MNYLGKAKLEGNSIIIEIPFDKKLISFVKSLDMSRWIPERKVWKTGYCIQNVIKLKESLLFSLDPELLKPLQNNTPTIPEIPNLYSFQKEGVQFIESRQGRALIADEMGLGKTVQALGWLKIHPELRPVLVICPASLKLNWKRETEKWLQEKEITLIGDKGWEKAYVTISNYDILFKYYNTLSSIRYKVLIIDECHYIKNLKAKRTKITKLLSKKIPHIIALSGTPITNRPIEFYNTIHILNPYIVPSYWNYAQRYCDLKHNGYGWDMSGSSNTDELHKILSSTIMLRRKKEDVLKELPKKNRIFLPIPCNLKEYKETEKKILQSLSIDLDYIKKSQHIEHLKQAAVISKLSYVKEWIKDFLEVERKIVLFCQHHFVIDYLMKEYGLIAVNLDGRSTQKEKQKAIDKFQNDPDTRIFIGNVNAAGVGITLTASNNIAFVELPLTPGLLLQAEDRCHRIGQDKIVNIYYLIAEDTVEERIASIINKKQKVLNEIIDGLKDSQILIELLKTYNL